jgi:MFS transporter, DHA1 family, tetracycline resistance protein
VMAFGMGWVYPSVSALAANAVEPHEQGAAAGSVAAAQGFGIILGPIAGTAIYVVDNGLPYALVALVMTAAVLWGRGTRKGCCD